ncbi:MAG TPA: M23 family metallopeptidase [Rectinemataceae bacterium]|nr:M23 family metallopeptidase [Rectinemataceae bacterium]
MGKLAGSSPRFKLIAAALLVLAVAAFWLVSGLMHPALPLPSGALLPDDAADTDLLLAYVTPEMNGDTPGADAVSLPPPPAMLELRSYTVRKNDSLASVARRFGIAVDTLVSLNGITNARAFRIGTELRIPNMNGLLYRVRAGDSISSIAKRFNLDATRLVDANDLGSAVIKVGQSLFIPGARLPDAELKRIFGEKVMWPLRGPLTSYFGYRPDPFTGVRSFHAGIDIAADPGTQVRAAMDGRVADVGYNPTYGNYIILSHAEGIQTLYGHLTSYSVRIGQVVSQGAVIGLTGSTGYSTGPHLHFGLYHHGNPVDPLKYLK